MAFKWGIRMSLRQVTNPHIKKSVATMHMAAVLLVAGSLDAATGADLLTGVIAIYVDVPFLNLCVLTRVTRKRATTPDCIELGCSAPAKVPAQPVSRQLILAGRG